MSFTKQVAKLFILSQIALLTQSTFAAKSQDLNIQDIPVNRHLIHINSKSTGPIMAGAGFSHDTQQIPPNLCYNVKELMHTGQQAVINLNTAVSFADFEKLLREDISAKGGYGMFSGDAEAEYMRTIQDLSYSLSLNYYEYLYNTVMLSLNGTGDNVLSPIGKDIYKNSNSYFGILCGDDFVSSYQQGALLLMGLNIRFASHLDKEEFNAKAGASWGNIVSASAEIQQIASQYHMNGTVIIQAYQKGGSPEELSKILSKDQSGVYYALSCDIQHMDNCVKAASGLMNYAATNFSTQIAFNPQEKGLTPLGIGFIHHDPVAEYGLTPPPSLVTPQVTDDRNTLPNMLQENNYYQQKFNEFVYAYPVPLDKTGSIYTQAQKLYIQSTKNIDAILSPQDPDDGALKCFNHPTLCHQTLETIQEQTQPITPKLGFLDSLSKKLSLFYDTNYWYPNDKNQFVVNSQSGWYTLTMQFTNNTINNLLANIVICVPFPFDCENRWVQMQGNMTGENFSYNGQLGYPLEGWHYSNYTAAISPNTSSVLPYQP